MEQWLATHRPVREFKVAAKAVRRLKHAASAAQSLDNLHQRGENLRKLNNYREAVRGSYYSSSSGEGPSSEAVRSMHMASHAAQTPGEMAGVRAKMLEAAIERSRTLPTPTGPGARMRAQAAARESKGTTQELEKRAAELKRAAAVIERETKAKAKSGVPGTPVAELLRPHKPPPLETRPRR